MCELNKTFATHLLSICIRRDGEMRKKPTENAAYSPVPGADRTLVQAPGTISLVERLSTLVYLAFVDNCGGELDLD